VERSVCREGVHNSWTTRKNGDRYCLPCLNFKEAVRDYKRSGYLGPKRLTIIESELDFRVSLVEREIARLQEKAITLKEEKALYQKIVSSKLEK
jgi:hypothetical protein